MAIIDVSNLVTLDEINEQTKKVKEIKEELESKSTSLTEHTAKIKQKNDEKAEKLVELTEAAQVVIDKTNLIESLEISIEKTKEEKDRVEQLNNDQNKLKDDTDVALTKAKEDLEKAVEDLKEIEDKIAEKEAENEEPSEEDLAVLQARQAEVSRLKGVEAELKATIDEIDALIENFENRLDDLTDQQTKFEDQKAEAKADKEEASSDRENHSTALDEILDSITELEKEEEEIIKEVEEKTQQLSDNQRILQQKEATRSSWNTGFEATAVANYVNDIGELSTEASSKLDAKKQFNSSIATALGISGENEDKKHDDVIEAAADVEQIKQTTLTASHAKVISDVQNYTMASLVKKIEEAAFKGLLQIKLETTLTKGVINALFKAGYDVHFEADNNKYMTIINWAHPGKTQPGQAG